MLSQALQLSPFPLSTAEEIIDLIETLPILGCLVGILLTVGGHVVNIEVH